MLQLESAMGAAIASFPGAQLLQVPRTRFVPVKTTDDLLVLRSDAYRLGDEFRVEPAPGVGGQLPFVALDKRYFGMIDDFERRMPPGRPRCARPSGWWSTATSASARGVVVRGDVEIDAPPEGLHIADGTVLTGS